MLLLAASTAPGSRTRFYRDHSQHTTSLPPRRFGLQKCQAQPGYPSWGSVPPRVQNNISSPLGATDKKDRAIPASVVSSSGEPKLGLICPNLQDPIAGSLLTRRLSSVLWSWKSGSTATATQGQQTVRTITPYSHLVHRNARMPVDVLSFICSITERAMESFLRGTAGHASTVRERHRVS